MTKPLPIDVSMRGFEAIYTDIEADDLPPSVLSFALNTQWINTTKVAKRKGLTRQAFQGVKYLKSEGNASGLNKARVLEYKAFLSRNGTQIYHIVGLQELTPLNPGDPTGFLYIELTDLEGTLVTSSLQDFNDGGITRLEKPQSMSMVQFLDKVYLSDGSESKIFSLDISTASNLTWSEIDINSTVNAGFFDNDPLVDIDVHTNKLFITGSKGKVYHSVTLNPDDFAGIGSGFIEYKATTGLIAKEIESSFAGLTISSENKPLNEYGMDLMTGTVPFDVLVPATESRGYEVKAISSDLSFIPGSIEVIDNTIVGLTQAGVVDLDTVIRSGSAQSFQNTNRTIELEETLSYPIDDIVREFDKSSKNIFSCKDPIRKRYYLSAPPQGNTATSFVYVHDYKFNSTVPKWSIWRLNIGAVTGLFTVKNEPYVADQNGVIYKMETGNTDDGTPILARIESSAVGGDTDYYLKAWDGVSVRMKVTADLKDKNFLIFPVADEFLEVRNNYDDQIIENKINNVKKFPNTFDRLYIFERSRTFDDDGFGAEVYFKKKDLKDARNVRIVIQEQLGDDGSAVEDWELRSIFFKGTLYSEAQQN